MLTRKNRTELAWLLVLKELQDLTINNTHIGVTALRPWQKAMHSVIEEDLKTWMAEM